MIGRKTVVRIQKARDYIVKKQKYDRLRHPYLIGQNSTVRKLMERDYVVDEKK
jgi:hypothetical protein